METLDLDGELDLDGDFGPGWRLAKCRDSGEVHAGDEEVNIVGSFVGDHRFQIHHVPHDGVFPGNAHTTVNLSGFAGNIQSDFNAVALGHGDLSGCRPVFVFENPQAPAQQLAFGDFGEHLGQFFLD